MGQQTQDQVMGQHLKTKSGTADQQHNCVAQVTKHSFNVLYPATASKHKLKMFYSQQSVKLDVKLIHVTMVT